MVTIGFLLSALFATARARGWWEFEPCNEAGWWDEETRLQWEEQKKTKTETETEIETEKGNWNGSVTELTPRSYGTSDESVGDAERARLLGGAARVGYFVSA